MSGNSQRVFITGGLPGSSNPSFVYSLADNILIFNIWFWKTQNNHFFFLMILPLRALTDYVNTEDVKQLISETSQVYFKPFYILSKWNRGLKRVFKLSLINTCHTSAKKKGKWHKLLSDLVTKFTCLDLCWWYTSVLGVNLTHILVVQIISNWCWGKILVFCHIRKSNQNLYIYNKHPHLGFFTSTDLIKSTASEEIPSNVSCE